MSWLIGLTGGIGSGKSRVAGLLEELGCVVECSDKIVRELQSPGGAALEAIREAFGAEYLQEDGTLDRAKLGALVFRDAGARKQLNDIVHPRVYAEYARRIERHRRAGEAVIVVDIPLLLEGKKAGTGSGAKLPFDEIVVVYARPETQLARVMARDGLDREAALARIDSQLPIDEKRELADVVIDNDGEWSVAESQVRAHFERWSKVAPDAP